MSDGFARFSKHVTRTQRWRALRVQVLRRDGHKCRECGSRGRLEVHHVRPVREAPELAFDLANLAALCGPCHARVTRYEVRGDREDPARAAWRAAVRALSSTARNPSRKEITCSTL
jgi:5-methylcytosine-specific restriction endonuclease McrA